MRRAERRSPTARHCWHETARRAGLRDWENLRRPGTPATVLRKPYVAEAEANLRSARADLQRARTDMDRTVIRAPTTGCGKNGSTWASTSPPAPLALAWATDAGEIRLPLTEHDASFVRLPAPGDDDGLAVTLRAVTAGQARSWPARVVRSESVIDERSRVLYVVARIDDPYNLAAGHDGGPLSFGTFVHADLPASIGAAAVTVPRLAIRAGSQVMVVDDQDRLRLREIGIVRSMPARLHRHRPAGWRARGGLNLDAPVDGMQVRVEEEPATAAVRTAAGTGADDAADDTGGLRITPGSGAAGDAALTGNRHEPRPYNDDHEGIIGWFARNSVAANLLMAAIVIAGLISYANVQSAPSPSSNRTWCRCSCLTAVPPRPRSRKG